MNMPLKFLIGGLVIVAGAWSLTQFRNDTVILTHEARSSSSAVAIADASSSVSAPAPTEEKPDDLRLDLDFASQAPTGSWDPPYDEACEEASLIVVRHFLESTRLDPTIMNQDILAMVKFEGSKGLPVDIDMIQLAQVARDMFGYHAEVVEGADVTIERIEKELFNVNPVIVPLAGQDIGNPYYSGEGPPYHVLVIVGYDDKHFVTHDVGTKRGEYYVYDKDVIMSAIHDWNGSVDTIRSGPKRMLIVTE